MPRAVSGKSAAEVAGLVLRTILLQPDTHTVPTLAREIGEQKGRVLDSITALQAAGWTIERTGGPRGLLRSRWPGEFPAGSGGDDVPDMARRLP